MIRNSLYHKCLRVSVVVCACVLVFQSGYFASTAELSEHAQLLVANVVGISAGVEPNELNSLTAELTKQKSMLNEREQAVAAREIAAQAKDTSGSFELSNFVLSALLLLLLILIIFNYVFDFLRARAQLKTYEKVA